MGALVAAGVACCRGTILNDPKMPTFHECRTDNDTSDPATSHCAQ